MKTILTAAAIASLAVSSALAADLPARTYTKAPPMAVPAYSWTGFYIGANIGWSRTESNFDSGIIDSGFFTAASTAYLNALADGRASKDGFTGGGQIGYNWQVGPSWLVGVEADFNGLSQTSALTVTGVTPGGTTVSNFTNSLKSEWIATVRGRLGYTFDRSLIYATGGLAVLGSRFDQTFVSPTAPSNSFTSHRTATAGWTVGGGWEYAFAPNWSVKAEYLYSRFEGIDATTSLPLVAGSTDRLVGVTDVDVHQARVGVNYKFGSPVVARY